MFREGTARLGADLLAAGNGSKRERLMTEVVGNELEPEIPVAWRQLIIKGMVQAVWFSSASRLKSIFLASGGIWLSNFIPTKKFLNAYSKIKPFPPFQFYSHVVLMPGTVFSHQRLSVCDCL